MEIGAFQRRPMQGLVEEKGVMQGLIPLTLSLRAGSVRMRSGAGFGGSAGCTCTGCLPFGDQLLSNGIWLVVFVLMTRTRLFRAGAQDRLSKWSFDSVSFSQTLPPRCHPMMDREPGVYLAVGIRRPRP